MELGPLEIIYAILNASLVFAIPLLLVALGGMFSEKSGVVNIALEGTMVIGAFCSTILIHYGQNLFPNLSPSLLLLLAAVVAIAAGILYSTLLAVSAIHLKTNQTITGTAMNILATALVLFIWKTLTATQGVETDEVSFQASFVIQKVPLLGDIPVIGNLFFQDVNILVYVAFLIFAVSLIVIYKTKLGLRLSACGEHPSAADTVGINVYKMRWIGILISGALGGLGGLSFAVNSAVSFAGEVAGYGFLAIAVMIFGQWKPEKILLAALFFGFLKSFSEKYTLIPWLVSFNPGPLFKVMPYVATMIVLIVTSKKSRAPKAEGIPYDQGAR